MAKASTTTATAQQGTGQLRFGVTNWALLAAALVAIVLGFVLLSGGSTVAAPLLLVLGYVVLMPAAIIL